MMQPTQQFIRHLQSKSAIDHPLMEALASVCRTEVLPRNTRLLKDGQVAYRLYFVAEGSARTFYDHDGKEITSWIYAENQLLTAWSSFLSRRPSFENIELTEDATLVSLSYDELQDLYANHPKMQTIGRLLLETQIVYLDRFYKGFMFMTAREKYDLLIGAFPDITLRVNLGYIASLLGISQETLSRIRKRTF